MFGNYTRIALIDTGNYRLEDYREFARAMASFLGLRFEEIGGSNRMLLAMLDGDWHDEFLVVEAGEKISLDPFK
jgi:hypothetical protein